MLVGFILYYVIDVLERVLVPWKLTATTHQVQV
jgi:NitT/TauT family transport system permease protein